MTNSNNIIRRAQVTRVFTPGSPVNHLSLFKGRIDQINSMLESINQRGQHPIIYGERGVGKTSLASVLDEIFARASIAGLRFAHVNCDENETHNSLWRKIFRGLKVTEGNQVIDVPQKTLDIPTTLAEWLNDSTSPDDVRRVAALIKAHLVVVIDEFDQLLGDSETVKLMANTIKTLSDHHSPVTVVLVGVADAVTDLIKEHQSIERNLVQVPMPRMSPDEIISIVVEGFSELQLEIEPKAADQVSLLAQGLPTAAHHLGLQLAYRLINEERTAATTEDVEAALGATINRMPQSLLSDWTHACESNRPDALFAKVLAACALAPRNEMGWFQAADIRDAFRAITKTPNYDIGTYSQHLHLLSEGRGKVLQRVGSSHKWQFRFRNPLFQAFVIMRALSAGMITQDMLEGFRRNLPA